MKCPSLSLTKFAEQRELTVDNYQQMLRCEDL